MSTVEYPIDFYNQNPNPYSTDDEQSNLLLYNQFLEQMKATHLIHEHRDHGVHPLTRLKEKIKKLFSHHKKQEEDHKGI